ncbi:MAG: HlyD family efflux transporter periplasmic adaptor subunit [Gemmataceae bacterium]|nr:HlyD family efflux transporter periplasmic adaptor subunit [Gemmataceae bacterium]
MTSKAIGNLVCGILLAAGGTAVGFLARDVYRTWYPLTRQPSDDDEATHGAILTAESIKLSAQAQANLRLVVKPLTPTTFWQTIQTPGMIVDRPAQSDRNIVAPVAGVVTKVHHFPGDVVQPGDTLVTLRLLSETTQQLQTELFKTCQEILLVQEQKKRLTSPDVIAAVPEAKLVEVDNQLRRLTVAAQAYRADLRTRGLTAGQIDAIAQGTFATEIDVRVGQPVADAAAPSAGPIRTTAAPRPLAAEPTWEIQQWNVELGQQVQAGQSLCLLSDHRTLLVEGRAFRHEAPLIERAAREGWPIHLDFLERDGDDWPTLDQTLLIRHIANTFDPASRTLAYYVALANQSRSFVKNGRTFHLWRFRPGQKVRVYVPVAKLDDVFVLPAEAVVRDGPNAYVFRQNGDLFERKPVHVVHEDRRQVVVANDGSVPAGVWVAHNGAVALQRALAAGAGGLPPGFHMHADGSIHANSAHK